MSEEVISKKAKKLVRWHNNYVVFVTPEAKEAGWGSDTVVRVSLVRDNDRKRIVIEKVGEI